jgi:hypothetical protein
LSCSFGAAPSRWSGHALPRRRRRRAALRLGPSGFDRCRGSSRRGRRPKIIVLYAARALDTTTRHQRTIPSARKRHWTTSRSIRPASGEVTSAAVQVPAMTLFRRPLLPARRLPLQSRPVTKRCRAASHDQPLDCVLVRAHPIQRRSSDCNMTRPEMVVGRVGGSWRTAARTG